MLMAPQRLFDGTQRGLLQPGTSYLIVSELLLLFPLLDVFISLCVRQVEIAYLSPPGGREAQ